MHTLRAITLSALTSLLLVACGASPDSTESTGSSQEAVTSGGVGARCSTDSSCKGGLVCEPICPVIPDRAHCEIAGGTCEQACSRGASSLSGETFTSADGVHSITFTSATAFTKTDGCSGVIHCEHVVLTQGTYTSNATTIHLDATGGGRDTLSVESHCYEGLVDQGDGVELWPASGS